MEGFMMLPRDMAPEKYTELAPFYIAGKVAARAGVDPALCPHPAGTEEADAWLLGNRMADRPWAR